jgi:chromosome partitioning protein
VLDTIIIIVISYENTMIITVGNSKGGVGKTTLALNIAIARALAGHDVWFIDGDRQGTGQIALTIRAENGVSPSIAVAQYSDGATLRQQVKQTAGKFDDVVIDVGGRDSTALRSALTLTDALIVPFAPRSFDVWSFSDMAHLIEEARSLRGDFPVHAVLNNADVSGTDNEEAIEAIADYPQLRYLDAPIRRRKSIATSAGKGLSVLEYTPKDTKACEEMQKLIDIVFI